METTDNLYWTGAYAVAHFGTAEAPSLRPCFLIAEGKGDVRKFTNGLSRAALFSSLVSADMAKEKENRYLDGIGHPLKGHLSVVEVYVKRTESSDD